MHKNKEIGGLVLSPNETILCSFQKTGKIIFWNLDNNSELLKIKKKNAKFQAVKFCKSKPRVYVFLEFSIQLWDLASRYMIRETQLKFSERIIMTKNMHLYASIMIQELYFKSLKREKTYLRIQNRQNVEPDQTKISQSKFYNGKYISIYNGVDLRFRTLNIFSCKLVQSFDFGNQKNQNATLLSDVQDFFVTDNLRFLVIKFPGSISIFGKYHEFNSTWKISTPSFTKEIIFKNKLKNFQKKQESVIKKYLATKNNFLMDNYEKSKVNLDKKLSDLSVSSYINLSKISFLKEDSANTHREKFKYILKNCKLSSKLKEELAKIKLPVFTSKIYNMVEIPLNERCYGSLKKNFQFVKVNSNFCYFFLRKSEGHLMKWDLSMLRVFQQKTVCTQTDRFQKYSFKELKRLKRDDKLFAEVSKYLIGADSRLFNYEKCKFYLIFL